MNVCVCVAVHVHSLPVSFVFVFFLFAVPRSDAQVRRGLKAVACFKGKWPWWVDDSTSCSSAAAAVGGTNTHTHTKDEQVRRKKRHGQSGNQVEKESLEEWPQLMRKTQKLCIGVSGCQGGGAEWVEGAE